MYDACVVGLGYVGLPTACAFAKSGLSTVGVDKRPEVVELVSIGKSHLTEAGLGDAVKEAVGSGRLTATHDLRQAVSQARAVVIAVQTPFEDGRVVLDHLRGACAEVAAALSPGSVVILESTVPAGTSAKVVIPILESGGKKDGKDFYFAYSPERMAPGNSLAEFVSNDRLIGAAGKESLDRAEAFLGRSVTGKLVRADLADIEVAKLVENTARDVYIAFANDVARISEAIGVDAREVIRLANTHPRVKILNPGPGVGGPCLTKDPYLLLEGIDKEKDGPGVTVRTARKVNDRMYLEVLDLVDAGGPPPRGSKVAVLGTAYKAEVGDARGSPSRPIVEELNNRGYEVWTYDPYCEEGFGAKVADSVEEASQGSSSLVVLVGHKAFRELDYSRLARGMGTTPRIIDGVGISGLVYGRPEYTLSRLGDGSKGKTRSSRGH